MTVFCSILSLPLLDMRCTLVVLVMFPVSSVLCVVSLHGSMLEVHFFDMTLTYSLAQVCTTSTD